MQILNSKNTFYIHLQFTMKLSLYIKIPYISPGNNSTYYQKLILKLEASQCQFLENRCSINDCQKHSTQKCRYLKLTYKLNKNKIINYSK